MKINPVMVTESIVEICKKFEEPLTESQRLAVAGALSVWLDKPYTNGHNDAIKHIQGGTS